MNHEEGVTDLQKLYCTYPFRHGTRKESSFASVGCHSRSDAFLYCTPIPVWQQTGKFPCTEDARLQRPASFSRATNLTIDMAAICKRPRYRRCEAAQHTTTMDICCLCMVPSPGGVARAAAGWRKLDSLDLTFQCQKKERLRLVYKKKLSVSGIGKQVSERRTLSSALILIGETSSRSTFAGVGLSKVRLSRGGNIAFREEYNEW